MAVSFFLFFLSRPESVRWCTRYKRNAVSTVDVVRLPDWGEVLASTRVFPLITPTNTSSRGPRGLSCLFTCYMRASPRRRHRPTTSAGADVNKTPSLPCPAPNPRPQSEIQEQRTTQPARDTNPRAAALDAHWSQERQRAGWARPAGLHPPLPRRAPAGPAHARFLRSGAREGFSFFFPRGPQSFFFPCTHAPWAWEDGEWEEGRGGTKACFFLVAARLVVRCYWY